MNNSFVPEGRFNLLLDKSFEARRVALKKSIQMRHAEAMATAGFWQRLMIHFQIHREYCREWKKVTPSIHALF